MSTEMPPRWAFERMEQERARYLQADPNPLNVDVIMRDPHGYAPYHVLAAYIAREEMPSRSPLRDRLQAALKKPIAKEREFSNDECFDPWDDIMRGIHGSYASDSDALVVEALEALRDRKAPDFIRRRGFAAEFMLYVLSGFGMVNYGTSPRGGWPEEEIEDLWQPLIEKWVEYADGCWGAGNWRGQVDSAVQS